MSDPLGQELQGVLSLYNVGSWERNSDPQEEQQVSDLLNPLSSPAKSQGTLERRSFPAEGAGSQAWSAGLQAHPLGAGSQSLPAGDSRLSDWDQAVLCIPNGKMLLIQSV